VSRRAEACLEPVTDPAVVSAGELAVRSAWHQNDLASRGFRHDAVISTSTQNSLNRIGLSDHRLRKLMMADYFKNRGA
jgi:hypothetical protein